MLRDDVHLRVGVVYAYDDESTFNPDWRPRVEAAMRQAAEAFTELTEGRATVDVELLGEARTQTYCWTPAVLGVREGDRTWPLPGSQFRWTSAMAGDGPIDILPVPGAQKVRVGLDEYQQRVVEIACPNPLAAAAPMFPEAGDFEREILGALGTDAARYDRVSVVFGRLGRLNAYESAENLEYRCSVLEGVIEAYSNLWFSENALRTGGLVDCTAARGVGFYETPGFQTVAHELLHILGAADIYDTGTTIGMDVPARDAATELDARAQYSIMGNNTRPCIEANDRPRSASEALCTAADLDQVYLDRFNRHRIGLPD